VEVVDSKDELMHKSDLRFSTRRWLVVEKRSLQIRSGTAKGLNRDQVVIAKLSGN